MMRTVSRRCCWPFSFLLVFTLLSLCSPSRVRADGGAPNLAYVSGTPSGISVIDVLQGKVTKIISVAGDPHTILLSLDGRFLYVTQPGLGQVSVILAETGRPVCTSRLPGKPAFLALDQYSNILYAAGSGAARVTALDPTTCAVQHVFEVESSPLTHITPPKAPAKQASTQKVIMSNILVIVACVLAILFL